MEAGIMECPYMRDDWMGGYECAIDGGYCDGSPCDIAYDEMDDDDDGDNTLRMCDDMEDR
jgi:hypothetical protein